MRFADSSPVLRLCHHRPSASGMAQTADSRKAVWERWAVVARPIVLSSFGAERSNKMRVEKYGNKSYKKKNGQSMPSLKGLLNHDFREYEKSSNPDIDPELKELNIILSPYKTAKESEARYHERMGQAKAMRRNDVKSVFQWVVASPKAISGNRQKQEIFFNLARHFLNNEYGIENEILTIVHFDESVKGQPHLHFTATAIKQEVNKKTGKEELRVGATKIITPEHLKDFHKRFDKFVTEHPKHGDPNFKTTTNASGGRKAMPTHAYKEIEMLKEQHKIREHEIGRHYKEQYEKAYSQHIHQLKGQYQEHLKAKDLEIEQYKQQEQYYKQENEQLKAQLREREQKPEQERKPNIKFRLPPQEQAQEQNVKLEREQTEHNRTQQGDLEHERGR